MIEGLNKVHIVSDGTPSGTHITVAGTELPAQILNVQIDPAGCQLLLVLPQGTFEMDIQAEGEFKKLEQE